MYWEGQAQNRLYQWCVFATDGVICRLRLCGCSLTGFAAISVVRLLGINTLRASPWKWSSLSGTAWLLLDSQSTLQSGTTLTSSHTTSLCVLYSLNTHSFDSRLTQRRNWSLNLTCSCSYACWLARTVIPLYAQSFKPALFTCKVRTVSSSGHPVFRA